MAQILLDLPVVLVRLEQLAQPPHHLIPLVPRPLAPEPLGAPASFGASRGRFASGWRWAGELY